MLNLNKRSNNEPITLEIRRNSYRIYPYIKSRYNKKENVMIGTSPDLDKYFKYFDKRYRKFIDFLYLYDKENKTLIIPKGVNLNKIEEILMKTTTFNIKDLSNEYSEPRKINNLYMKDEYEIKDKYQAESIDFLTTKELSHSKMLALYTGRGKTYCAISSIFRLKEPALIISQTLADQWVREITKYTKSDINDYIKIINGTENLRNLLNKQPKHIFYITTSTTLFNYINKYKEINSLIKHLGIGIKCFDELHMNFAQNVLIDSMCDTENTFYLTATPSRSNPGEAYVFKKIFETTPVYGLKTFFIGNYFNIRCIDYNTQPNDYERKTCYTNKGFSSINYWNYIFKSQKRIMYILGMIKMLIDELIKDDEDVKILIFLAKKDHIIYFKDMLEKLFEGNNLKFGDYTTNVDKKYKKFETKKNIIFTTIGSGAVGLDTQNLIATFSLVPFSSNIIASQMMGRLRYIENKEVYHYDFIDKGFPDMEHQRMKRLNIYKVKSKSIKYRNISMQDTINYLTK